MALPSAYLAVLSRLDHNGDSQASITWSWNGITTVRWMWSPIPWGHELKDWRGIG